MTLGEFLRYKRRQRGLKIRDLEQHGISNPYLSQLETGKMKNPSAIILYKLSIVYGFDIKTVIEKYLI